MFIIFGHRSVPSFLSAPGRAGITEFGSQRHFFPELTFPKIIVVLTKKWLNYGPVPGLGTSSSSNFWPHTEESRIFFFFIVEIFFLPSRVSFFLPVSIFFRHTHELIQKQSGKMKVFLKNKKSFFNSLHVVSSSPFLSLSLLKPVSLEYLLRSPVWHQNDPLLLLRIILPKEAFGTVKRAEGPKSRRRRCWKKKKKNNSE